MSKQTRYAKPFDDFTLIRRKAHRMVMSGEWTQTEASAWIERKDAELEGYSEPEEVSEPEKRVNFPDQGHMTAHGYKETSGSITPHPEKHLTKWNENE